MCVLLPTFFFVQVLFMQSDGGLTSVADFSGHKAILSGPAGACGWERVAVG
jgi:N-methylhydantoinase A/oxoprolinase/acetone carboxylase beta subunit